METLNDLNLNFKTLKNGIKTIIVISIIVVGVCAVMHEILYHTY